MIVLPHCLVLRHQMFTFISGLSEYTKVYEKVFEKKHSTWPKKITIFSTFCSLSTPVWLLCLVLRHQMFKSAFICWVCQNTQKLYDVTSEEKHHSIFDLVMKNNLIFHILQSVFPRLALLGAQTPIVHILPFY